MANVTYVVIAHDGGFAYRAGETISETFPTHEAARQAAAAAAREQTAPGEAAAISYENAEGEWLTEDVSGSDRPHTDVRG